MKYFTILICLFSTVFFASNLQGQTDGGCETAPQQRDLEKYRHLLRQGRQADALMMEPVFIPVHFHIIRRADGSGFNSFTMEEQLAECDAALDTVNQRFKAANIQFYRCMEPNFILNTMFYDSINVGSAAQQTFTSTNFDPSVVNVYFTRRVLSSSGSNRCGWARFPWDSERWVIMNYNCLDDRNTFAHELGHYFGLLHTHETAIGVEGVTRTSGDPCFNCSSAGDLLCDTPADPTLQLNNGSFLVDNNCNYTGTATDACGVTYAPDSKNIMSYTIGACGNRFSGDQVGVINQAYTDTRQAQLDNSVCNQTPCIEHVVLPNVVVSLSKKVNADKTITSQEIIATPASEDVQYDAGQSIVLRPGFHATLGVRFRAFIDGCYLPQAAPMAMEEKQSVAVHLKGGIDLMLSPNPSDGLVQITVQLAPNWPGSLDLYNQYGQLMQTWSFAESAVSRTEQLDVNLGNWPAGVYTCILTTHQTRTSRKLVLTH